MPAPSWLTLLAPLPSGVTPRRKPVASVEQIEKGTAGPIAGWTSISINLSEPEHGLRHLQITFDQVAALRRLIDDVLKREER